MTKTLAKTELQQAVDALGRLQAKINDLRRQAETIRQPLIDAGIDAIDGRLFHATVSRSIVKQVDYKGLLTHLKASARLIHNYTQEAERITVRVVARSTNP